MASYSKVEEAYKSKDAAIKKKVAADAAGYDAQRTDIGDSSISTLQQIYIQNERNKRGRDQNAKAAGLTGGAVESAQIADRANYMKTRNETLLNRDKQIAQVDIAQGQTEAQAEIERQTNKVAMETGRLSFNQTADTQKKSDAWEIVKAGVVTPQIAKILGWPEETLRSVAKKYKEG